MYDVPLALSKSGDRESICMQDGAQHSIIMLVSQQYGSKAATTGMIAKQSHYYNLSEVQPDTPDKLSVDSPSSL